MKLLSGVALVLATLTIAACGGSSDDSTTTAPATDTGQDQATKQDQSTAEESSGADGKEIFTANCASCHTLAAADASGTVGPDLDSVDLTEDKVHEMVENGGGAMPPFGGQLSSEEISAVASFVSENSGK